MSYPAAAAACVLAVGALWAAAGKKQIPPAKTTLLCCCAMLSFCVLPFAPLGIDNAVTGVCFFCMYWMLILMNGLFPDGLHHETGAEGEGLK